MAGLRIPDQLDIRYDGEKVKNVCCPYITVQELCGCTLSTRNTCHFGKNTLFYNGRQHLPVCVLQLLVAMAVTESLYCRKPWETFELGSRVLKNTETLSRTGSTAVTQEVMALTVWRCHVDPTYPEWVPCQQLMSDDRVQQLGQAERDVGVVVGVGVKSSPLFET